MSCYIYNNNKEILECSIGTIENLLDKLQVIIYEKNIKPNNELDFFLNKLNELSLTHGGVTVDIKIIFTNSKNLLLTINLLKSAITDIKINLKKHAIDSLWGFYKELMIYEEELSAKGL